MKISTKNNHILESTSFSFASILNLFKDLGTFSNYQELKNGVAFDIVLNKHTHNASHPLRFLAIGHKGLRFLKDGRITSPLAYQSILKNWAELSQMYNMHLLGLDPHSGKYYISDSIFWEVTRYICPMSTTKSITMNELDLSLSSSDNDDLTPAQYHTIIQTKIAEHLTDLSQEPKPFELLQATELIVNQISELLLYYKHFFFKPRKTPLEMKDLNYLETLFQLSKTIFGIKPDINELLNLSPNIAVDCKYYKMTLDEYDFLNITSQSYWIEKSIEEATTSKDIFIKASSGMKILHMLVPRIINKFRIVRKHSAESVYYWLDNDADFLKTVLTFDPPEVHTTKDILNLQSNLKDYRRDFEKEITKCRKLYRY